MVSNRDKLLDVEAMVLLDNLRANLYSSVGGYQQALNRWQAILATCDGETPVQLRGNWTRRRFIDTVELFLETDQALAAGYIRKAIEWEMTWLLPKQNAN